MFNLSSAAAPVSPAAPVPGWFVAVEVVVADSEEANPGSAGRIQGFFSLNPSFFPRRASSLTIQENGRILFRGNQTHGVLLGDSLGNEILEEQLSKLGIPVFLHQHNGANRMTTSHNVCHREREREKGKGWRVQQMRAGSTQL